MSTTTDKTKDILKSMLTENTGRHLLDSGGAYGRHWERNQEHDFDAEPVTVLKGEVWGSGENRHAELSITHNVYGWLAERVTYDEDLDRLFGIFADSRPDSHYLTDAEEFPQWLYEQRAHAYECLMDADLDAPNAAQDSEPRKPGGIYGEGEPMTVNTYNNEDALSQVLQYVYWSDDLGEHALISIHGGCDVRGGYTRPRAFEVSIEEYSILDNARVVLFCQNEGEPEHNPNQQTLDGSPPNEHCHAIWESDDAGYSFRGSWNGSGWDTHTVPDIGGYHNTDSPPIEFGEQGEKGKIIVTDEGKVYCPVCGRSTLGAGAM